MRSWGPERTIHASVIRNILQGKRARGPDPHGVRLRGCRIEGTIDLEHLTSTVPLDLTDCFISEGIVFRGATLATVAIKNCWLGHPRQPPLVADRLTANLLALICSTVTAHSTDGTVTLAGAHLRQLDAHGTTLTNDIGPALDACGLNVDGDVELRGFKASGRHRELAAIRLLGAKIGGRLNCAGAELTNEDGRALDAAGLSVGGDMELNDGFNATGGGGRAAVRLLRAKIGGRLYCPGAKLTNEDGRALDASSLSVGGDMELSDGFNATGGGGRAAVRLLGAKIGGRLYCPGAKLTNEDGRALDAAGLSVGGDMELSDGFNATGGGGRAAVRLLGAHIGGQLNFPKAVLTNDSGPALDGSGLIVDQDVILDDRFIAAGGGKSAVVDLSKMRVGSAFVFRPLAVIHATDRNARLNVDGFTYAGLPEGVTSEQWLQLIQKGTRSYAAQPYQYLAKALNAAGDDGKAREVLIAQRQDQLDRKALTGRGERAWARFTGAILGYGYKPSRALLYLLGVIIISIILSVILGPHGGLAKPNPPSQKLTVHCTALERIAVGLDLGTPLISTNTECRTTTSSTGNSLAVANWSLRVLAWGLATLFIAGFTSAVRKT